MAVAIEEVKLWAVDGRGIGHAVGDVRDHCCWTACNSMFVGGWEPSAVRPPRVCRKCRKGLKECNLVTPEAARVG